MPWPVTWERTILFPNAEYFIVMDRASSTQTWAYASLFTPTTHDLQKGTSSVQNISLKLSLNGAAFSWEGLSPKKPTAAGTTSSMTWQSRNVHHANAQANLFTVPASEVSVTRMIQRGYGNENVDALNYMPHVLFKQAPAKNLYRVTSLVANLATEAAPSFASVAVTGTGNALAVTLGSSKDYAYSGTGTSQFGPFATDADLVYARGAPPSTSTRSSTRADRRLPMLRRCATSRSRRETGASPRPTARLWWAMAR